MTWPIYPTPGAHPALDRHADHMAGSPRPGPPGVYGAALDVWRDGVHLGRSWPIHTGEYVDTWARRTFAHLEVAPTDHDNGIWQAAGVHIAPDHPVPTPASLMWIGGAQEVSDLMATVLAMGQLPDPPDVGTPVSPQTIHTALSRADEGYITRSVSAHGVTVRALIGRCAPPASAQAPTPGDRPPGRWQAVLERREVRAGAVETELTEGSVVFEEADARPHILARRAKRALGISGWGAQRQPGSLVWHIVRAPYRVRILSIDGAPPAAIPSTQETTG